MPKRLDFAELSLAGQRRLFESAARQALGQWRLAANQLDWVSYSANAVFSLRSGTGRYILRLHPPGAVPEGRLRSELMWLRSIRATSELLAPLPVPQADGRLIATLEPEALLPGNPVYCVLFERLPGESKRAADLTMNDMRAIGTLLARLHSEAQILPGPGFERPRLDAAALTGAGSAYALEDESLLSDEQREIFMAVSQRAATLMDARAGQGAGFGLIHADLLAKNLLFSDDKVAALDFENCAWGPFLYDLAPLLWQLKGERPADYARLETALWQAYAGHRQLDDNLREQLETMTAVRQVLSCRWLLQNSRHGKLREMAPELIQARCHELRRFLASGRLERGTVTL